MPPQPVAVDYVLVLGSNRRPARHFRLALRQLPVFGEILQCAGPLRTRDEDGGRYLNAALLLRSSLPFDALRDALHVVESGAGRERGSREVTLDIDIVASRGADGAVVVHKPGDLRRDYVRALLDELDFDTQRR